MRRAVNRATIEMRGAFAAAARADVPGRLGRELAMPGHLAASAAGHPERT